MASAAPQEGGVRIRDLARRFGEHHAVRGITLEIAPGETFGLLGPNGAGKTTTLRMLATLLPPSSGDAEICGHRLSVERGAVRRAIGLAPQDVSLYPDLSAEENLRFFGRLYGVRGETLRRRVDGLLDRVGLAPRRHDRVRSYSGGMQRRLNLACSLVHDPQVVLLDEPTAGVDPQSRANLFELVREIAAAGACVVYTTHYMEEAERLCDRIAILDEGRLAALGSLAELLDLVGAGEVIEVRGAGNGLARERLAELPGVRRVEGDETTLRLVVENAARVLAPLGAWLAESGGAGAGVRVHPVDLGTVFLHLTGRELRDA